MNSKFLFIIFIIEIVIILLVPKCEKNTMSFSVNRLTFVVLDNSIKIENNNLSTVFFLIVERETSAIIDWSPGCELDYPEQVKASHTKSILFEDIMGYKEDCEIVVYWWFCIKKAGEDHFTPDDFQSTIIKTK